MVARRGVSRNYPDASKAQRELFREHGWLVVEEAVAHDDLAEVSRRMEIILEKREKLAFAASLHGKPVEFWNDQLLAKPPRDGAPTYWHQDEDYWGRSLDGLGLTCWLPLHDVDETNGCMCFVDRGHRDGILEHFHPEHIQSDLLYCEPDLSRRVACPIRAGSVTFHHGKTPHRTPPNTSVAWRRAVTTHMRVEGSPGEGDHFPWKTYVDQIAGETTVPPRR